MQMLLRFMSSVTMITVYLEVGETWTYSASHTVDLNDLNAGSVVNVASSSGQDTDGQSVTDVSNEVTVTVDIAPRINLTKTGNYTDTNHDGIFNVGDQITYTFIVENTGNVVLTQCDSK